MVSFLERNHLYCMDCQVTYYLVSLSLSNLSVTPHLFFCCQQQYQVANPTKNNNQDIASSIQHILFYKSEQKETIYMILNISNTTKKHTRFSEIQYDVVWIVCVFINIIYTHVTIMQLPNWKHVLFPESHIGFLLLEGLIPYLLSYTYQKKELNITQYILFHNNLFMGKHWIQQILQYIFTYYALYRIQQS